RSCKAPWPREPARRTHPAPPRSPADQRQEGTRSAPPVMIRRCPRRARNRTTAHSQARKRPRRPLGGRRGRFFLRRSGRSVMYSAPAAMTPDLERRLAPQGASDRPRARPLLRFVIVLAGLVALGLCVAQLDLEHDLHRLNTGFLSGLPEG